MNPRNKLSPDELIKRFKDVKLLSFDVDGVLTDGGLYFADDGRQLRKFHAHDGVGIKRAMAAGVELAIITASKTEAVPIRAGVLGIQHVFVAVDDKLETFTDLCKTLGIDLAEAAHVGDDLNDLPLLQAIGLPLTVANAVPEVLEAAHFVTGKRGGDGAVREICDFVVAARVGEAAEKP